MSDAVFVFLSFFTAFSQLLSKGHKENPRHKSQSLIDPFLFTEDRMVSRATLFTYRQEAAVERKPAMAGH